MKNLYYWGRDVIWDSIRRPFENLQYTKKTHLQVLNLTSAISYLNQSWCGKLPKDKLYASGRFVTWYSGQQGHPLGLCPGVCFKVSDQAESVCHFSFSFCMHCHWELNVHWEFQRNVYFCSWRAWQEHLKLQEQWDPETLPLNSKAHSNISLFSIWILDIYWSEMFGVFSDWDRKIKWDYCLNQFCYLNSHHVLTFEVPSRNILDPVDVVLY